MAESQPGETRHWLAETKFHPPLLREDVIPRRHLLHDLCSGLASHPLTLLSAPAGYGKTTLLAALFVEYPDLSLAWLSLDHQDNDPIRFLTALTVALQHLNPACCTMAWTLLTDHTAPGMEGWHVVSVLINDLLESFSSPFALILDDLHVITNPAIYIALDYLLEHMPPLMHLVVASRVDPPIALARLRARGQIAELRLAGLRFSNEEALIFLNDRLGLDFTQDEVAALQRRTEGWAVGLRLLAESMDRSPATADRRTFMQQLVQSDTFVFEFLAEEVLNLQEPGVRAFLLETAVLSELTPELCEAVTARADAQAILEDLMHRNIFLVATGVRAGHEPGLTPGLQHTYRYHDLFAEFLLHKLRQEMPERVPELHMRAAQAAADPAQIVAHYLSAARWQEAAEIIEQICPGLIARGYLDTLGKWINALPPAVQESHPRLLYCMAHCAVWRGSWQEAKLLLERALALFEETGDRVGQGEALAKLATITAWPISNSERSEALLNQALMQPLPQNIRVQVLLDRASLKLDWGNWVQAEQDFNEAIRIQEAAGLNVLHIFSSNTLDPAFAFLPGGLEHMERFCDQGRALVSNEISPMRLIIEEMTTVLHLFRGHLREAIRSGEGALVLRERLGGHPFLAMDAAFFLIIAHAALGDYAALERLFNLLFMGVEETTRPEAHRAATLYFIGRIRWLQAQGQPDSTALLNEAADIYAQMCALEDPQREIPADAICRVWMWSLLEMAAGRYQEAERALRQPEVLEQKDRYSTIQGNTRLMLGRLYLLQDRPQEALGELSLVLDYHKQLGTPFTILLEGQSIVPLLRLAASQGIHKEYATSLLTMLGAGIKPRLVRVPTTGATLTHREVEVLRLIIAGASNRTIGEKLVIAESTVKTHIHHIFTKLDVSNRTEAVARARELNLL